MSVTYTRSPNNAPSFRSVSNDRSKDSITISLTLPSGFSDVGKRTSRNNNRHRLNDSDRQTSAKRRILNEESSLLKKGALQASTVDVGGTTTATAVPQLELSNTDSTDVKPTGPGLKTSKPDLTTEPAVSTTATTLVPTTSEIATIQPDLTATAAATPSTKVPLSTTAGSLSLTTQTVDETSKMQGTTSKMFDESASKPQPGEPLPSSTTEIPHPTKKVTDLTTSLTTEKSGTRPSDVSLGSTSFTTTTRTPRLFPRIITREDMESLREFVRMDNGLPLTRSLKRKSLNLSGKPPIPPKMNRASMIRTRYIRTAPSENRRYTWCGSSIALWQEGGGTLKHLKQLADRYKSKEVPSFRFNRGFEVRYQSNKGEPSIPSSFRKSYEEYNKPIFHVPRKLEIPKRYLWAHIPDEKQISYLGLRMNADDVPLLYQSKQTKPDKKPKRDRLIVRPAIRVRPKVAQYKGGKRPWNYGLGLVHEDKIFAY